MLRVYGGKWATASARFHIAILLAGVLPNRHKPRAAIGFDPRGRKKDGRSAFRAVAAQQAARGRTDGECVSYAVDGLTDSLAFAKDLVRTARVGVAPGRAFACGPNDTRDEAYLRLCFAQSPQRLKTGLGRIADALNR